mmetsp:Transcript_29542/g.35964  ORF Transcript_29542/g.35964 Transcript_29542/m.35964 type:complete len:156 (-) Transcript_29542:552-1019(-)
MILSALRMVPSRWAMTRHVRSFPNLSSASWTDFSVTVSRADVASSRMTMGGFLSKHLAMATRCFSPPLNFKPRSPTKVSQPSAILLMKLVNWASRATSSKSSAVASLLPYKMLLLRVSLNSDAACGTTPMDSLRLFCVTFLTSTPFTLIQPSNTS